LRPLSETRRRSTCHHARAAVAAVGLGRRLPDGPERLPSNRTQSSRTGTGSTTLIVHSRGLARHPVARREPCHRSGPKPRRQRHRPRQRLAGRLELPRRSSWTVAPLPARRRPRGAARKMPLSDFCNRPNFTSTCRLSDSGRRTLAPSPSCDGHGTHAGSRLAEADAGGGYLPARCGVSLPVELRLTANLQLRRSSESARGASWLAPWGPRVRRRAVLVEPRSTAPLRDASRRRRCSRRAEPPTSSLTSSIATRLAAGIATRSPRSEPPCPPPSPSRQRRRFRRTRTPSVVRVLPPPVAPALSRSCVGSRGARHRSRCLRACRLSPTRSGFRRLFAR